MKTPHFNLLEPDELERLAVLSEECGEVIKAVGKILRHGYESQNPHGNATTNRETLEREIGDVIFAIDMMVKRGDISDSKIGSWAKDKELNIKQWLHHQEAA